MYIFYFIRACNTNTERKSIYEYNNQVKRLWLYTKVVLRNVVWANNYAGRVLVIQKKENEKIELSDWNDKSFISA